MTETLIRLARLLLCLLPFVLFALLNMKANLSRPYRSRQFPMPLAAVVYCGVLAVFLERINLRLAALLALVPGALTGAGDQVSLWFDGALSGLGEAIQNLGALLEMVLAQTDPVYVALIVGNALFMLAHIVLKGVLIAVFRGVFRSGGAVHDFCVEPFYEQDGESGIWYVRDHCGQARTFLKTMYLAGLILSVGLTILSCEFYRMEWLSAPFYPVFGVVILGELYFFADGLTRRELEQDLAGERDEPESVCNYMLLRQVLARLFGDKLGAENTTVDTGMFSERTHDELLHDLEESDRPMLEAYGRFMRRKLRGGLALDHNYLVSGMELLQGKSILFNNPFYYDLIPYIFYPMNRVMLRRKKVLIILGRHDIERDIVAWCQDGLTSVTNVPDMWSVGVLSDGKEALDVGIVTRSSVHDLVLHEANGSFFRDVEFVVIIEPSKLVTTAQIGLNSIVRRCRAEGKQLTFCSTDRNCDGLVDALSHILLTSLTEVSATGHHKGVSSYMCWEADDTHLQHRLLPNLSRYLGMGTELSFCALKNQVPVTEWYGGETFPVVDIHWIARQYYYDLLHYAQLPTSQETMDEHFRVSPNLWNVRVRENQFLTVEDEGCNMFEMKRTFATRARNQGFVNIISSEYLLKDYMLENDGIFNADPKAIAHIVADYAPTPRNILLRLCLRMSTGAVCVEEIRRELILADLPHEELPGDLWRAICACCSGHRSSETDKDGNEYLFAAVDGEERRFSIQTLRSQRKFSTETGEMEDRCFIDDRHFVRAVLGDLRNAGYIAEDEHGQRHYLGAELRGHVFQKYLPGQFFTFGGKYYEMLRVTGAGHVLVRRAADHITGRPSYRQVRHYTLSHVTTSQAMGDQTDIAGLHLTRQYADLEVDTPAYWRMERYNDFGTGRLVSLNGVPRRAYRGKQVLRIDLPELDGMRTNEICNTVALLFNEVFRTLFAENQPYIAAVAPGDGAVPTTYSLRGGEGAALGEGCIYIIEDSQLDLGLLVAVERNLGRIFSILCDYLDWHLAAVEASLHPPARTEPPDFTVGPQGEEPEPEKHRGGLIARIASFFKRLFRRKPKEEPAAHLSTAAPPPVDAPSLNEPPMDEPAVDEPPPNEPTDQGEDAPADDLHFEPEQARTGETEGVARKPYHQRYYLLYGGAEPPKQLDLPGTLEFLEAMGFGKSELKQARAGKDTAEQIAKGILPDRGRRQCDFCGAELVGTEYEILSDGRERCMLCSRTAVKTEEEFREIYQEVVRNLGIFFGVRITAPVRVEMVNAKKLHRRLGKRFVPTGSYDGRVLGVAIKSKGGYSILVENGAPRMQSTMTMAHELIHIWQYLNWDQKQILQRYGKAQELEVYEGMAKWGEIQYAYLIGETAAAKREELMTRLRQDEYGCGFRKYAARYPLSTQIQLGRPSPFHDKQKPL